MAIKLDISKACDWVEWGFLCQIMLKLGIDAKWLHLSMEIVTTASYSVLINGEPKVFVSPSRGIRQEEISYPCTCSYYV